MERIITYKDTPTVKGQISFNVKLSDIPSVQRLATAVSNIVEIQPDGVFCSCDKYIDDTFSRHTASCIELNEAYKDIKE